MQAYQVTFRFGNYGDGEGGPVVIYGKDLSLALATLPQKDRSGNPLHEGIKSVEYVGEIKLPIPIIAPPLTWQEKPTSAGWWWKRMNVDDKYPKLWRVILEPNPPGETKLKRKPKGAMTIEREGGIVPLVPLEQMAGEWSGPVELEKAPD